MMNHIIVVLVLSLVYQLSFSTRTTPEEQIEAVKGLITRVLGSEEYLTHFDLHIDQSIDYLFEISGVNSGTKVGIVGSDGVSLSSGFYFYIREFMNSMFTWETSHIDTSSFPVPETKIVKKSMVKYRYMFNTCTFGYTMGSWTFKEWERFIDWMALHGYNLPLAFVGQEYVFMKTFESFGISQEEMLSDYFSGPLFLPWNRMGNIRRWGGPLSENYINQTVTLQKQILERERSFGMFPVLPGYPGFLPDSFVKKYPQVSVIKETAWNSFNQTYTSLYLLEPTDPIFVEIGSTYLRILNETYGLDHFYSVDTFNEMPPPIRNETYLKMVSESVYTSLTKTDPDAVWVLQGWMFVDNFYYWTKNMIKAYLSPVPNDRMLLLDLWAEFFPAWKITDSFFGKPFIWCLLKNFGGRRGLYGNILDWTKNVVDDNYNKNTTMVGTGISSEAVYLPPLPFELFSDMYILGAEGGFGLENYEKEVMEWVMKYVSGRYGYKKNTNDVPKNISEAMTLLINDVYNYFLPTTCEGTLDLGVIGFFPSFDLQTFVEPSYYTSVSVAYRLFHSVVFNHTLSSISSTTTIVTDGMKYDYVDLTRQYLSNLLNELYNIIFSRFYDFEWEELDAVSSSFLDLVKDLDDILLTTEYFLLGRWIESARNWGTGEEEKNLFEFNARNLISLWGPLNGGVVTLDYAQKSYGSLVGDYYYNRWKIFFKYVTDSHHPFDKKEYEKEQDEYELSWQTDFSTKYPTEPTKDLQKTAESIYGKYVTKSIQSLGTQYKPVLKDTEPKDKFLYLLIHVFTRDVITLTFLCDVDPLCFGFTTDGRLFKKKGVEKTVSQEGVDMYIKK